MGLDPTGFDASEQNISFDEITLNWSERKIASIGGRPRGTVGKASASEARGPGFEPPWLVQRSRWESRPLSLVGNGAGAVTHPIDRAGTVFPRGTGRFLVKKGVHIASFRCLSDETLSLFFMPLASSSCAMPPNIRGAPHAHN